MIQRLCHRCRTVLQIEDESSLVFCWNCGAAQVTLSEELQEQAAAQRAAAADLLANADGSMSAARRAELIASQPPDLLVVWKSVINITAAVAAGLSLACLVLPLQLLAWMAPSLVLAIYCARHKETQITAAVGARVGLVCGILCAFGITLAETVELLVLRFGMHRGGEFDGMLAMTILQAKERAVARSGQAAADMLSFLNVPEFRIGLFLFMLAFGTAILLLLSTASGAFSGYMRSRNPAR